MRRNVVVVAVALLGLVASTLTADIVHLKDGRKIEGKAVVEGNTVKVVTRMGTVSFPKDQVAQIEETKTPAELYKEKVAALKDDDAEAHYELAMWCKKSRLRTEMNAELERVIAIDPNHEKARQELNFVKIDDKWVKAERGKIYVEGEWLVPEDAVARGRTLYEAEKYEDAYLIFNKAAETVKKNADQAEALLYQGMCSERLGKWDEAIEAYGEIVKMRPDVDQKFQAETRRDIIEKSPGGMFLVKDDATKEDIFTIDTGEKEKMKTLKGLQSLQDPLVMKIAMRERCSAFLQKGKDFLKQAKDANNGTPEGDEKTGQFLDKADAEFEKANRIQGDVARGFLVESVKVRVGVVNNSYNLKAARLQGQIARLNAIDDRREQVRLAVVMVKEVDGLLASLDTMEKLASTYPDELSEQIASFRALRGRLNGLKASLKAFAGG